MSQVGWLDSEGTIVPFEEALAIAAEHGSFEDMPYEVLLGMHQNLTKERPDSISVTQLLGCPRKVYLEGTTDYAVPPADNYPAFRGMIVHGVLEATAEGAETETRVEREYRGVTISGQPDNLRVVGVNNRKLLRDWKSVNKLPMYDNAYNHHQEQVNLYRWLLGLDWRLTDLELVYLAMDGVKVIPLKRGGTNRYGRAIPMQVWTDEEVEAFLDKRLMVLAAQRKHESPVAYHNVSVDDLWNCAFCPVQARCYELAADEAKAAWSVGEEVIRIPPRKRAKKR
ncbi:MAG TPA: PD-(D/E)XK nuclease family protein [Gemmatimonadales bacterium]|nr:PD-(D/E)XK nuclease family protein [Gemmatimonadales bacterium]